MIAGKKTLILPPIVGLVLAASALWLYAEQLDSEGCHYPAGEMVEVVVAKRPVRAYTVLTFEDVQVKKLPARFMPPGFLKAQEAHLYVGQRVRVDVEREALVLATDFDEPDGEYQRVIF